MSLYSPDAGALPNTTAFVHLLADGFPKSSRDLSLQIPVNFVNLPGVSLTPACFAFYHYEEASASKCISNLLALGFRRIEIDIYWDVSRQIWSLCPVQLGNAGTSGNETTATESQPARSSATSLESAQLTRKGDSHQPTPYGRPGSFEKRQISGLSLTTSTSPMHAASTNAPLSPTYTSAAIKTGPYSCTAGTTLDLFLGVLVQYLDSTETNLNATTRYVTLNLHAAADASDPSSGGVRPAADALPQDGNLLSALFLANTSAYLYTPSDLSSQRANLNDSRSWFGVLERYRPDAAYFTVDEANGHDTTPDGWPGESYLELVRGERLLVSYGTVDPQMDGYNFSADAEDIFAAEAVQILQGNVVVSNAGVTTGCYYQPGQSGIGKVNSSWATYALNATLEPFVLDAGAANLSACGISPILNATLSNVTAAEDFEPYRAFADSALWTWDIDQPHVSNSSAENCAALNATSGRWRGVTCGQQHYGACRVGDKPYEWSISESKSQYYNINFACRDDTSFGTPRTALENTYLVATWRSYLASLSGDDADDKLLWVNFNDLDVNTCWVIGQNATCPYTTGGDSSNREIVVPTVAAVIVFVLAGLTMFVKCAANRRNTKRKRRRRGEDGWDYEGVPS
ncbi:Maintenance of telomere capping protein 6 [Teratosphaeria destructans]|uniref:Maintenance of telomere capping protein 6 n=1 Tax=Teratosphaeria destructans TaxID=418781 RepID=A0A9W7W6J9_9PEZI|nr:Maintenance of telomere capping protein 6 [Teratosphaeria destructans]